MSRWLRQACAVFVVFAILGFAMASSTASAGQTPPTVTIQSLDGTLSNRVSCQGDEQLWPGRGIFEVSRDRADPAPLSITLSYGGTLEPGVDYDALPATVTIPADETNTGFFSFSALVTGNVTAAIEPDVAYSVGSPGSTVSTVTGPVDEHECRSAEPQTIAVGQTPAAIAVYETYGSFIQLGGVEIEGTVPPGLTFNAEGTWEGTATTAGAFEFVARYCINGIGCIFNLTVAVTVVATGSAPARPVVASPTFTG